MVKISSDSTCDLGELTTKYNISIMPLKVILDENIYRDGIDISPEKIFDFVKKTGKLPTTSAPSPEDFIEFFKELTKDGDEILHFTISSKASSSYNSAVIASSEFNGKVHVIDSTLLSSGQGILIMKAIDLLSEGKDVNEVIDTLEPIRNNVNLSFVPDRLDYLYKGGRCSKMEMYGANILHIHPLIDMNNGELGVKKKYRGNMSNCIKNYIRDLLEIHPNYDKKRCFITHSTADRELVNLAKECVDKIFKFDEVIETVAGSVITGHCGRNTLGLAFIYND